ncbi:hypothetical protein F5888DRAFT_1177482 [Russula emetica]|nr:hypothetical protein F5888DRAFT_1177482 [Russula emetica]
MTALDGVHGTVCNEQQYNQSLQSYDSSSPSISCLTHGESIGLVLIAEASLISLISIVVILIWIGWNVRWYRKKFPNGDWKLFQRPADIYMFSLFVFDILQATGGILNIRWAHNGIVTTGHYCTAQGLIQQIGELGVALITLLLAVHTFVAAVLQVGLKARGVALSLVCLACIFIMLWVVIGADIHKNYETPTPYWCWISPHFPRERLGGEYIWMWIALLASAILYNSLYFWAEGFWSVDDGYRFHWWNPDERVGYTERRAKLGMLLYPLAYSLVILPLTIARCLEFGHHNVPTAATFFGVTMFYLSGVINVLLLLIVRPRLLLFPRPKELDGQERRPTPRGHRTGPAIVFDTERSQHSPEPTSAWLGDEGSWDSATPSYVKSGRISDDI